MNITVGLFEMYQPLWWTLKVIYGLAQNRELAGLMGNHGNYIQEMRVYHTIILPVLQPVRMERFGLERRKELSGLKMITSIIGQAEGGFRMTM